MHTATRAAGPPPDKYRRSSPWAEVARQAEAEPGQWFVVDGLHASSVATYLRREWGLEVATVGSKDVELNGKTVKRCEVWVMSPPKDGADPTEGDTEPDTDDSDPGPTEAPPATEDEDDGWADAVVNPDVAPVA